MTGNADFGLEREGGGYYSFLSAIAPSIMVEEG
jgi:hypothetical protein